MLSSRAAYTYLIYTTEQQRGKGLAQSPEVAAWCAMVAFELTAFQIWVQQPNHFPHQPYSLWCSSWNMCLTSCRKRVSTFSFPNCHMKGKSWLVIGRSPNWEDWGKNNSLKMRRFLCIRRWVSGTVLTIYHLKSNIFQKKNIDSMICIFDQMALNLLKERRDV